MEDATAEDAYTAEVDATAEPLDTHKSPWPLRRTGGAMVKP